MSALGASGTVTITGYIAEVGGTTGINYATSNTSTGSSGGRGRWARRAVCAVISLIIPPLPYCTATYTAPASDQFDRFRLTSWAPSELVFKDCVCGFVEYRGNLSNPSSHQAQSGDTNILLGSSGGNNNDLDTQNGQPVDCCGGTLGALIQNSGGTQYLLSCNHVLARSDQATTGEMIIQPGLIDNSSGACYPVGNKGTESKWAR